MRMRLGLLCLLLIATTASAQSLEQQAMCAKQAKAYFQEDNPDNQKANQKALDYGYKSLGSDYVSHYNAKLNRCFVLVDGSSQAPDGRFGTNSQLADAFERRIYATYGWTSEKGKRYWEVPPTICELMPKGKPALNEDHRETTNCSSKDEYDAFVAKYMEE